MDNKTIARTIRLYAQLMELHEENPFRTKAMAATAFKLDKLPFAITTDTLEKLGTVPGIGKSAAEKVASLLTSGSFPELDVLMDATPQGVREMMRIKGLGPKKVHMVWRGLGIESTGELYYACNENRLIEAKGFGLKTQEEVKKSIEFLVANQGWSLYANIDKLADDVLQALREQLPPDRMISHTGDFRRKCETLQSVDLLLEATLRELETAVAFLPILSIQSRSDSLLEACTDTGVRFRFIPTDRPSFYRQLIITTGSDVHLRQLGERLTEGQLSEHDSEEAIYRSLGLEYIAPELREGTNEVALAEAGTLPTLICYTDLRGTLHNHSTYSDGVNTLEEMALYCKDVLRLEYLGICDHSKTAVYAKGLNIDTVQAQWAEIDALNTRLAPFRIFKGIESDILGDGSLDYPDEILAGFDFVVASIHSNLQMDMERATTRLVRAIENPHTTVLGHPTGRLLLSRPGYPIDYARIIDACAAHAVAIEINANPLRLDLDWRWHRYAVEKGVLLSINPDAHRNSGFHDMQYGIHVARKGGLTSGNCLNTLTLEQLSNHFQQRKERFIVSGKSSDASTNHENR